MGKGMKRLFNYCTCKVRVHLLEPVLIEWTCFNPGGLSWQSAMLLLHEAHVAQTHSSHLALPCCLPFVSEEQFATKISELYGPLPMALNDFAVHCHHCCGCFCCLRAYKVKMNVMIYGAAMSACEQSGCWQMALGLLSHMGSKAWKRRDGDEVFRMKWVRLRKWSQPLSHVLIARFLYVSSFTLFFFPPIDDITCLGIVFHADKLMNSKIEGSSPVWLETVDSCLAQSQSDIEAGRHSIWDSKASLIHFCVVTSHKGLTVYCTL